ncbi:MAG: hypothetical protein KGI54_06970 [Pseudomonadota bacterium]|nr:hypothetical protein [Pseudomonadota bacterium]
MTNAYQRRLSHKLSKRRQTYESQRLDNFIRIDRFMLSFENAWLALYGEKITIQYRKGWYWIMGRRMRHSAVERITEIMQAEYHERELGE